jgi:hypothetical protein
LSQKNDKNQKINNIEKRRQKSWKSCPKVVKKLSKSCTKVVKKLVKILKRVGGGEEAEGDL